MKIMLIGDSPLLNRLHGLFNSWMTQDMGLHIRRWDQDEVLYQMLDFKPDVVVNGHHSISETPDAFVSNSRDPSILALFCKTTESYLYHLSDAMVFPGRTAHKDGDEPYPAKVFGLSRLLGERGVLSMHSRSSVVRLGWLYGSDIPESPPMIAWDLVSGKRSQAYIYTDLIGSPTFVGDAAEVLAEKIILDNLRVNVPDQRIFHLAPTWVGSWYDLLSEHFPTIEPATVRSSVRFRDLHRNAGLRPSNGWVVPDGGVERFIKEVSSGVWHPTSDMFWNENGYLPEGKKPS